jgi:1-aminocyclopropane-1-carboxylate deaminase/D-cysteine desulfhydrase-like pyridoxal-dependent ACC family enzyme
MSISILHWGPVQPYGANKIPKLKGFLEDVRQKEAQTIVAIGGPNSNLLWAVAEMAKSEGYRSVGLVRGESKRKSELLALGMELVSLPPDIYRLVCENGPENTIPDSWYALNKPYFIPEGASNLLALDGVIAEASTWKHKLGPDVNLVVPIGTGATMAGIALALSPNPVIGFAPFKDAIYCSTLVHRQMLAKAEQSVNFQDPTANARVFSVTKFGRYGRPSAELLNRLKQYEAETGNALNPIYAGFCLVALEEMFRTEQLDQSWQYVIVNTGGHYDS